MQNQANYLLEKPTKIFVILTYSVCLIMGSAQLIREVPYTPWINLIYVGLISILLFFKGKIAPKKFNFIFGCLTTLMIFSFSYFTGDFSAPVFKWLLPVFVFVAFTCERKNYIQFLFYLFILLFGLMYLKINNLIIENLFVPKNLELFHITSTIFSIVVTVILIKFFHAEKKDLETDIEKLNERNELIITSSGTGIWDWVNVNEDYVFWSDKLYEILKLDKNKIKPSAMTFMEMMHEGEIERSFAETDKQLAQGDRFHSIIKMNNGAGETIHVKSQGIVLRDANNEIYRRVGSIEDITELIQAKEDLEVEKERALEASQAKSEFISNMTHEIRTPLNAIIGITDMLKGKVQDKEHLELVNDINSSGEILFSLVSDILDISKLQQEKFKLFYSQIDLTKSLERIESTYSNLFNDKGISFNQKHSNIDDKVFELDEMRIFQIINNLLSNSYKFTFQGKIEFEVKYANKKLYFTIKDTGIGISKEDLPTVFDSFTQVDSKLSKQYRGTGLGLSIVKELVQFMSGEISIDSELGKGTTVSFWIPTVEIDRSQLELDAPLESKYDLSKIKVLVAEDNMLNIKVISNILENLNIQFDVAKDGEEAISFNQKNSYHAILMDLQMPKMDGITATKEILKSDGHKPIIIALTATATEEVKQKTIEAGMQGFLSKPVRKKDIKLMFEKLL